MAKTLFIEGYHEPTIRKMLSLEGFRVSRSAIYNHFTKHDNVMALRKGSLQHKRMKSKTFKPKKTNPFSIMEILRNS